MKKILVFIDWYLPGYKAGGPIRSMANLVGHLNDKFEFLIVTRNIDYLETVPYPDINPDKWLNAGNNQKVLYLSGKNITRKKIRQIIKQTDFDIAYINGVYSFYFSLFPLIIFSYFAKKESIVAPRGMFSAQGLGVKIFKKKVFVFFSRLVRLYQKSIIHVTSQSEMDDIEKLKLNPQKLFFATNLPPTINKANRKITEKKPGELKLVSIARISAEKNTLFALECLQKYQYKGNIVFDLYGPVYQQDYWEKCKVIIKNLPENIKVNYCSELNNKLVVNTLSNYHFLFLPSKGENFGHSILESLMNGCPVIISNKTPWQNIEKVNAGWDINLEESESFAQKIQEATNLDDQGYKKMSENAKNYALRKTKTEETKLAYCKLFG